jgi:hypothetical protein
VKSHGLETDEVSWLQLGESRRFEGKLGRFGATSWALRARRQSG